MLVVRLTVLWSWRSRLRTRVRTEKPRRELFRGFSVYQSSTLEKEPIATPHRVLCLHAHFPSDTKLSSYLDVLPFVGFHINTLVELDLSPKLRNRSSVPMVNP